MFQDHELIKRVQQGETHLFNQIITQYQKLVYFSIIKMLHGRKSEAEDLTQEVFLAAYRSIKHFRQDSSLSTWLLRIATNKTIDYKRKKQIPTINDEQKIEQLPGAHDPLKEIIEQESKLMIEDLLSRLPEPYRHVLELYYFKNLSYKEIAFQEGIEVKTVESRLYRARNKLKSLWREEQKHEV